MKKIIKLTLTYSSLILIFNSCCRSQKCKCEDQWGVRTDDCTPRHYGPYYLGGLKDYLYFEKGSYWIYKNNLSGETDSIYTVYCDTFIVNSTGTHKRWLTLTYTDLAYKLRSDKYNVDYIYNHYKIYPDVTNFKMGYVYDKIARFPTKSAYSTPFCYPFSLNINFQELIPSLTIQGKTYNEVAVFQQWIDDTVQLPSLSFNFRESAPTKYYWAKDVGLVMIEQVLFREDLQQTFTQKWELINYNLIK